MTNHKKSRSKQAEIAALRRHAETLGGGGESWVNPDLGEDLEHDFWKHVVAFESAPRESLFQKLAQMNIALPPPGQLPPGLARRKAHQVRRALQGLGVWVYGIDKITPQEFYFDLWHDLLRDEYEPLPPAVGEWRIDLLPERDSLGARMYAKYFLKPMEDGPDTEGLYHVTFKL